jgi:PhnB protein
MQFTPYLNFNGNCKEAFEFYEKSLGGKIIAMLTHADTPVAASVGPEWHDRIMHARLQIGDAVLMASDSPPESYEQPKGFSVSIHVDDPAEAERIFHALAEGAEVQMPIQETFWAVRFAMLTDRFGTPWMINCEKAA